MTTTTRPAQLRSTHATAPAVTGTLVGQAVRDRLGLVGAVSALMIGMGLMVGALWPSLKDTFADLQDSLPDAFSTILAGADMSTPSGWANAEMMSMVAPAGVIAVGAISASRAIAGEEEDKTLGMLLGAPVSRASFLVAKSLAMVVHVLLVSVAVGAGLVLGNLVGDMGLSTTGILGAGLHTFVLGVLVGGVAVWFAAWTGSRRLTTAAAAGLAGLSFALASFLPLADSLADGARLSPWYYYNSSDPLANGADPWHLLVLLVLAAAVLAAGLLPFRRRDLRG